MTYQPFCDDGFHDVTYGRWQGNCLAKRVSSSVVLRRNRALTHAFLRGRCHTACNRSRGTARGTVWRTSASREFTMLNSLSEQCGMSQRIGAPLVLESQPRKLIDGEATRGDDVDEKKL